MICSSTVSAVKMRYCNWTLQPGSWEIVVLSPTVTGFLFLAQTSVGSILLWHVLFCANPKTCSLAAQISNLQFL